MKLTDSKIKGLKNSEKRYIEWDQHGLGIRVSVNGKKSFVLIYRFEGRPRMMTLGEYPKLSLKAARTKAAKAMEMLDADIDPGEEMLKKKAAHRSAPTVSDLVAEYLERHAKKNKVTWREDERCLNKDVLPFIGERKAKDVKNRDIVLLRDRVIDRGADSMANRLHNVLTKLFNFAVERGVLDASPCAALKLPAEKGERHRALEDEEIRTFWISLDDGDMEPQPKLALKLLLVTGQRRSELVKAEWKEFDLKSKQWEIPVERIKTRKRRKKKKVGPHLVPLSELALEVLRQVKEISGDSPYLFPSPRTAISIDPALVTRALRRSLKKDKEGKIELEPFTVHDLRRTAATGMASAGVPRFNVSQVLNHETEGVTDVYDKHGYFQEKKDA
ncbi:MAG: tyrosine-type recombinase/integrase, partial [Bdellovibrionales bacterium]|nr:tyrosine-type recombinase/integrase [Bdellovibrionales bacterium]